jgi:hypothetical protein
MGTVDYRLLPAFVQSLRANAGEDDVRVLRGDVDELLERLEAPEPLRAASVHLLPSRDG